MRVGGLGCKLQMLSNFKVKHSILPSFRTNGRQHEHTDGESGCTDWKMPPCLENPAWLTHPSPDQSPVGCKDSWKHTNEETIGEKDACSLDTVGKIIVVHVHFQPEGCRGS